MLVWQHLLLAQLIQQPVWHHLHPKWAAKCLLRCLLIQKQPQAALPWAEHVDNAIP
jgi:hypothetical protein